METIMVTGSGAYKLSLYKDTELILSTPCFVGAGGIAENKKEGDQKTPSGIFGITAAFGTAPDPGSGLPYTRINEYMYLVDDPESEYYNRIIDIRNTGRRFASGEHMIDFEEYKYGAVIDYNSEMQPGRGSGIFLHVAKKPCTAGCVSAPESAVRKILKVLAPGARIIISKT